jgi:phospho-N-acetylmuramoyl-pentapeptide-transferase
MGLSIRIILVSVVIAFLLTQDPQAITFYGLLLTSYVSTIVIGLPLILILRRLKHLSQPIRIDGPQNHFSKQGTPTMGGSMILLTSLFLVFFSGSFFKIEIMAPVLLVFFGYGLLGIADDLKKILKSDSYGGLSPKQKLFLQMLIAGASVGFWLFKHPDYMNLYIPIIHYEIPLGLLYPLFAVFVVIGASNAVNLTDGLDGLVTLPTVLTLSFLAYLSIFHADHLSQESRFALAAFLLIVSFSCIGFLVFNFKPARIFMGDTGSLALGGLIGITSIILKAELLLAVTGFLFVLETISVMIQVLYFKKTGGKRFFKMAPLHHHFEYKGWSETKVVFVFWGIAILSTLVALKLSEI